MLVKIVTFYLLFLSYLFLGTHLIVEGKQTKKEGKCIWLIFLKFSITSSSYWLESSSVKQYKSPGSVRYPVGDEELNNNLLDEVGINEAMEKHDKLNEYGLKCRDFPDVTECQVENYDFISWKKTLFLFFATGNFKKKT